MMKDVVTQIFLSQPIIFAFPVQAHGDERHAQKIFLSQQIKSVSPDKLIMMKDVVSQIFLSQ
jgi:hypothetical protein